MFFMRQLVFYNIILLIEKIKFSVDCKTKIVNNIKYKK